MTALASIGHDIIALVSRSATGDDAAFAIVVRRFQPLVFRWALALCGDDDEAEDITQEVFIRVHRKLSGFRGDGPFEGWLYRITRRVLIRTRRPQSQQPHLQQLRAVHAPSNVYTTDPGMRIDRERAVELIRTIAAELPLRQREVFMFCDLEGRTPAEVSVLLNVKDVSVRASLFKARASIRRTILMTHPRYREYHE